MKLQKKIFGGLIFGIIIFFNAASFSLAQIDVTGNTGNRIEKTELSVPIPVDCDIVPLTGELDPSCEKTEIGGLVDIVVTMYRFAVGAGIFLAIIMIILGGIQYTTSELPGVKDNGLSRIKNAIFGLMLLALSIPILSFINPQLTLLSDSEIAPVKEIKMDYTGINKCDLPQRECNPGQTLIDYGDEGDDDLTGLVKQCDQNCEWITIYYDPSLIPIDNNANPDDYFDNSSIFKNNSLYQRTDLCGIPTKKQCFPPSSTISYEIVTGTDNIKAEKKHYCTNYCEDVIEYRRCEEGGGDASDYDCSLQDYNINSSGYGTRKDGTYLPR